MHFRRPQLLYTDVSYSTVTFSDLWEMVSSVILFLDKMITEDLVQNSNTLATLSGG